MNGHLREFPLPFFSDDLADFIHKEKRCGDEQRESGDPDRWEGGHAVRVEWALKRLRYTRR